VSEDLRPGDLVTLSMPRGPLRLVVLDVIPDPRCDPYVRCTDNVGTVVVRREWMYQRGWEQ
jgi:hypothetical protein